MNHLEAAEVFRLSCEKDLPLLPNADQYLRGCQMTENMKTHFTD